MTKEKFDKKIKWTKIFGIILEVLFTLSIVSALLWGGTTVFASPLLLMAILDILFIIYYALFYSLTRRENIAGPIIGIILGVVFLVVFLVFNLPFDLVMGFILAVASSNPGSEFSLDIFLLFIVTPIFMLFIRIFVIINSISMLKHIIKYINPKTKILINENINLDAKKENINNEDINLDSKNQENETKNKKHTGRKVLIILALIILFIIIFIFGYSKYEATRISWDTGNVKIAGKEIHLPCKISEFENKFETKINNTSYESPFVDFYINEYNTYIDSNINIKREKKIQLYIKDDFITGIKVDISNMYNDYLDYNLGKLVIFPQNITTNSDIDEIHEAYRTGLLNLFMRDYTQTRSDGNYSFKYGDEKYSIDIGTDGKNVKSIFYYYCGKI